MQHLCSTKPLLRLVSITLKTGDKVVLVVRKQVTVDAVEHAAVAPPGSPDDLELWPTLLDEP